MAIYLNTYRPLASSAAGWRAAERHALPPYVDASIRREPDLQSRYPSISALCRGRFFAPRLHEGDTVVYMTVKGEYPGKQERHRRLVAVLDVLKRFESHADAARWYQGQNLPLPSNCMVPGNLPHPLSMAVSKHPCDDNGCGWDERYQRRAKQWGTFLACKVFFLDLTTPPPISDGLLMSVFGRIPPTRTPPAILARDYEALLQACGVNMLV